MLIKDILDYLDIDVKSYSDGFLNSSVEGIDNNSKNIKNNYVFVAIKGNSVDGHKFIESAINSGAILVIASKDYSSDSNLVIKVEDTRLVYALLCKNFYAPIPKNLAAVTGTNGKTSVTLFCSQFLKLNNISSCVMGTTGIYFDGVKQKESLTTPDSKEVFSTLQEAKLKNIDNAFLEASSHGIDQKRLEGLEFNAVGFTNLTLDHLDYHLDIENYYLAKRKLFFNYLKKSGIAVINVDDDYGKRLKKECLENNIKVVDFGFNAEVYKIINVDITPNGSKFSFNYKEKTFNCRLNVVGTFQIYNILCSMLLLVSAGFDIDRLVEKLPLIKGVKGRLELVSSFKGAGIYVDYAHTPLALQEVLINLRKWTKNQLKVVFGCGGNRDKSKRFIMGEVAAKYSDVIYITDDNPRFEEPELIREEIERGVKSITPQKKYYNVDGREKAINEAMDNLKEGDILLIAGKGHEEYQIVKDNYLKFSDYNIILNKK